MNKLGASRHSTEPFHVPQLDQLIAASRDAWDAALIQGEQSGYRNSQVTVLAPTGTIGFMMDCDTTGVEPDLALVKYKKLVGGGMIKIVNSTVPSALIKLGYTDAEMNAIVSYIDATGTIEGAPGIKPEHLACFDCSFKPAKGTRSIHYMGHIKMMAAAQPFLSGAISKTVNLPNDCSVQEVAEAYMQSWRLGIKAVAIYRDGSKGTQPLNVSTDAQKDEAKKKDADAKKAENMGGSDAAQLEIAETIAAERAAASQALTAHQATIAQLHQQVAQLTAASTQNADALDSKAPPRAVRHRLPAERASVTHKFALGGHEGYITVGLYPNGSPGEIFIRMAKEGSTVSGLMDSFATAISLALQHGVPLKVLASKFAHTRFEPSGWTGNEQIGYAKSIMDYIFRWMEIRFLSGQQLDLFAGLGTHSVSQPGNHSIPVVGTIGSGPAPTIHLNPTSSLATDVTVTTPPQQVHITNGGYPSAQPSTAVIPDAVRNPRISSSSNPPAIPFGDLVEDRTPPREGIAPDLQARSGMTENLSFEDRGIYHAADAMKDLYDMGDSPSCATCGAIMTRSGSCYRCMSCGNTSGCS